MSSVSKTKKVRAGARAVTDKQLQHRSMRQVREYATADGEMPLRKRRLEDLATAFAGKDATEATAQQEGVQQPPQEAAPQLRDDVLLSLKEMGLRSLTKMQCRIINMISCSERTDQVRRIVAQKLQDRQVAIAVSLLQLCGPKSRAQPIVVASRSGANMETNSAIQGLDYLLRTKLKGRATTVMDGTTVPSAESWKGGPLLVDASAVGELSPEHWKKCSHLIVYHEGGADSHRALLVPEALNPKAQKIAVVTSLAQLSHPFVSHFVGAASTKSAKGPSANVQLIVTEGLPRLQALWTMLNHLCGTQRKKVAVCLNSREITAFHCDLFYALPQPEIDFEFFCDWESNTTNSADVQQSFASASTQEKGAVLLSAFGSTEGADVVVCYDPCPLAVYTSRVASTVAAKQQLVVFLYPSEQQHVSASLTMGNGEPDAPIVNLTVVDAPVATRQALTMVKVKSLVKKVFALAAKAFEAYKSNMAIYTRLTPSAVYNVRALNLEKISEQFGLPEVPMLDLRTSDNRYRPTEDYIRPAKKRQHKEVMALRKKAAAAAAELSESDPEEGWGTEE